jgi:hypothetical protein
MRSPGLYRWLQECQLDPKHEYYHGWAESRDFLMELAEHYPRFEFAVAGTFMLMTPPPSSEIPIPLVTASSKLFKMTFVENWVMEPYYTVSISREHSGRLVLSGFVEQIETGRSWLIEHVPDSVRFSPVTEDALQFTGAVQNRHMLFGLFRILEYNETAAA